MKKLSIFALGCVALFTLSCTSSGSGELFNGQDAGRWTTKGDVTVQDGALTLNGSGAQAVFKNGKYKNFELSMELRSTPGGSGAVYFHTDPAVGKGYGVSVNNNLNDPVWWKMSGSLLSVRNLTKSFVKENDWYRMNIRVDGKAVSVTINGQLVVEYVQPDAPYRIAPNENVLLSEGTFAIVSNGLGGIQFRSIAVEALDDKGIDLSQQAFAVNEQTDEIIRMHQEDFPVLDFHVHLKGGLTKEVAAQQSRRTGINYAVAPNCGIGFPVTSDQDIYAFLDSMRTQPYILAMQAEGREWLTTFSQAARDEFDYVFTDALTFTDNKGRRTRLWITEETWIENEEQYMDMIVDRICSVLQEPVDVYVNPCFLPPQMQDRYDQFWTEARMNRFVEALAASGKALEINELYNIPNKAILAKAKAAGVKFTFGTNNVQPEVSMLEYSIRMKKELGLKASDMYRPKVKL